MNNNNNKYQTVNRHPKVSVVMPVYNVHQYLWAAIHSVLNQSFADFELVIVDDGSTDGSYQKCQIAALRDKRIRVLHQENRGLSGARNTGIHASVGQYIALLDSDDIWHKDKLKQHVELLDNNPSVGVSYCRSAFIDDDGEPIGLYQTPNKLQDVAPQDVLLRNPIGNGSVPVIRREVFEQIATVREGQTHYFDEALRQSEDIECWVRMITTTDWQFQGLADALTYYRVNNSGLSANIDAQFKSWMIAQQKMRVYAPELIEQYGALAQAYQYRYLARRAIRSCDMRSALRMSARSLITAPSILIREPVRTITTLGATICLSVFPIQVYKRLEDRIISIISTLKGGSNRSFGDQKLSCRG